MQPVDLIPEDNEQQRHTTTRHTVTSFSKDFPLDLITFDIQSELSYTFRFNISGKRKFRTRVFVWIATKAIKLFTGLPLSIIANWPDE